MNAFTSVRMAWSLLVDDGCAIVDTLIKNITMTAAAIRNVRFMWASSCVITAGWPAARSDACLQLGVPEPAIRQDLDRHVAGERAPERGYTLPIVCRTLRMRRGERLPN